MRYHFACLLILICICLSKTSSSSNTQLDGNKRREALVNVFKMKLLELLDLKEAPNSLNVNISRFSVPEPVMQEYNRLIRESDVQRVKPIVNRNILNDAGIDELNSQYHDKLRFSAITEELILSGEESTNNEWCHSDTNEYYKTLNCISFSIENHEFFNHDLKSGLIFMKFDITSTNDTLLFIEINDIVVKKVKIQPKQHLYIETLNVKSFIQNMLNKHTLERSILKLKLLKLHDDSIIHVNDKQLALNVKFGDEIQSKMRFKRSQETATTKKYNLFQECSDLKHIPEPYKQCCRESIRINMDEIGWNNWIVQPEFIDFKFCRGSCKSGQQNRFYHTSIVQRIFSFTNSPNLNSAFCCNIYDYEKPIQLLYHTGSAYDIKEFSISAKTCMCS